MRKMQGLPSDLGDAARAYMEALPIGDIVGFPIASIDRIGLPVWVVAFFPDDPCLEGIMPYGVGYGETDAQAILGALGEVAEMVFPELSPVLKRHTRGTWHDLAHIFGAAAVADPLSLCLPAGSPVDRDTPLEWVEARRVRDNATVLVPIELAAYSRKALSPGYAPFTTVISNGMGAGPSRAFALGHALFELLQRDGNGLLFRALDQGVVLDLPADAAPPLRAVLDAYARAGVTLLPKFVTDEFGFANVICVGFESAGEPPVPIMLTACGEACDPDRGRAVLKAMTEFAASRARKAFAHGPAAIADRLAPRDYVCRFMRQSGRNAKTGEARAFTAMQDWTSRSADELRGWLAGSVHAVRARKDFAELPAFSGLDACRRGALAAQRLGEAGLEPLVVDHSPPGAGIAVVKAIVPGLEVETMSYHRIGARNARKLIERDHPLIRFGKPSDTLRPVRLTPQARAEFGRQPLFDTALADRIVGPLYPLYREPEAHHVAAAAMDRAA